MAFGLFLDFKSVPRNSDSQAEVSKNGVHMTDANVKSVVTPQMTASAACMYIYLYMYCTWVHCTMYMFFLTKLSVPLDFLLTISGILGCNVHFGTSDFLQTFKWCAHVFNLTFISFFYK